MSRTSSRIARNLAIVASGIKPSHKDHPGHESWLEKQNAKLKKQRKKTQDKLKAKNIALEKIIIESGKVDIDNWPKQQQICQSIAESALKESDNG